MLPRMGKSSMIGLVVFALAAPAGYARADPAVDPECEVLLTSADQIEPLLDQIAPFGYTSGAVGDQIGLAAQPLLSVANPAGMNLRNWAFSLVNR